MALDLDAPPIYNPVTKDLMSDSWVSWVTTFQQTLSDYLSQFGMFVPNISTADRDKIQSPVLGQLIYNTTTNELQVWQIKLGTPLWRAITTVP
jgi:hypothetical protein